MDENRNPYEAPVTSDFEAMHDRSGRWFATIWAFAIIWPLVSKSLWRFVISPATVGQLQYYAVFVMPAVGYLVCIVAAVRYPAPARVRWMRGMGSILLMIAAGMAWTLLFGLVYIALRQA